MKHNIFGDYKLPKSPRIKARHFQEKGLYSVSYRNVFNEQNNYEKALQVPDSIVNYLTKTYSFNDITRDNTGVKNVMGPGLELVDRSIVLDDGNASCMFLKKMEPKSRGHEFKIKLQVNHTADLNDQNTGFTFGIASEIYDRQGDKGLLKFKSDIAVWRPNGIVSDILQQVATELTRNKLDFEFVEFNPLMMGILD